MKYPQVVIHKGERGGWLLTIDGVPFPYVTEVHSVRTAAGLPQVTIVMIGELYQEDAPVKSGVTLDGYKLCMWAAGAQ